MFVIILSAIAIVIGFGMTIAGSALADGRDMGMDQRVAYGLQAAGVLFAVVGVLGLLARIIGS